MCECDKLCNIAEYLDYKNCRSRKKTIDKLIEECSENISIYAYFFLYSKNRSTNSHYFSCLNINGY